MAFADTTREVPVLKRMIQMETRIIRAAIVSNPFVPGSMHVRGFWMAGFVGERLMFRRRRGVCFRSTSGCRAVRGNVPSTDTLNRAAASPAFLLRQNRQRQEQ